MYVYVYVYIYIYIYIYIHTYIHISLQVGGALVSELLAEPQGQGGLAAPDLGADLYNII